MVLYELGVVLWGRQAARDALESAHLKYEGQVLRNAADVIIRHLLGYLVELLGWSGLFLSGLVIVITLIVWQVISRRSWSVKFDYLVGMFGESILYASLLPLVYVIVTFKPTRAAMDAVRHCWLSLTFDFGAGVYEEFIFRLVLVSLLALLFRGLFRVSTGPAKFSAAVAAAVIFAGAHHIGPLGDEFNWMTFAIRSILGLFFGAIFVARGFGVAAGTHVFYNIIVRILILNG